MLGVWVNCSQMAYTKSGKEEFSLGSGIRVAGARASLQWVQCQLWPVRLNGLSHTRVVGLLNSFRITTNLTNFIRNYLMVVRKVLKSFR